MKKPLQLFALLACLFFAERGHGQGFTKPSLMLGINASQIDGDNLAGWNKPGLAAGGAISFNFDKQWAARLEIQYNQKGSRSSQDEINQDQDRTELHFKLDYITVPLMAEWNLMEDVYLVTGVGVNALVRARLDKVNFSTTGTGGSFEDVVRDSSFNALDFTWELGAEYRFSDRFLADVRFSYSMLPMNQDMLRQTSLNQVFVQPNAWNNTLQFSLRYILDLKTERQMGILGGGGKKGVSEGGKDGEKAVF